jgi:hypothetical protein
MLALLAACGSPTGDRGVTTRVTAGAPVDVTLHIGDEVMVDSALRLSLLSVSNDSRCPVDVLCVWVGTAAIELGLAVGSGPTVPDTLWTTFHEATSFEGYDVTLQSLLPEAHTQHPIQPAEYEVHLSIARQ